MNLVAAGFILTWILMALLGFVVAGLIRQVHELRSEHRDGVEFRAAPTITVPTDLATELRAGKGSAAVLVVRKGCRTCHLLAPTFSAQAHRPDFDQIKFSIVSLDPSPWPDQDTALPVVSRPSWLEHLEVPATPYLLMLGTDGDQMTGTPVATEEMLVNELTRALVS